MLPTIKFRSLSIALLVLFATSGYAQAEQTMEQTEKWLNNYARNEIRFIGADFGDRSPHVDFAFSECKLTGKGQYHHCSNPHGHSYTYRYNESNCSSRVDYQVSSFALDFSKVRPHEIQAEGNNVIKVKDETAWETDYSEGKLWAKIPIVAKPHTINRGVKALKHYAKMCNSELDDTF